ncbi:MAG: hypothetical protein ACI915_004733 [Gammaproteobacteria bacterium]|jgi:hypothetical protein
MRSSLNPSSKSNTSSWCIRLLTNNFGLGHRCRLAGENFIPVRSCLLQTVLCQAGMPRDITQRHARDFVSSGVTTTRQARDLYVVGLGLALEQRDDPLLMRHDCASQERCIERLGGRSWYSRRHSSRRRQRLPGRSL